MRSLEEQSLDVRIVKIDQLRPFPHNARTHSKRQIRQIAKSMDSFGFPNPVLIDAENTIISGHGRVEAAKLLGMTEVPTRRVDWLTQEQIRAYAIADNKLALNAGWDPEILAIELEHLLQLEGIGFDVTVTGFEVPEIDMILQEATVAQLEDAPPEPAFDQEPVASPGDLYLLGKHKVICGNSLHLATYQAILGSRRAAAVFTDPPYNVKIDGHATGNGAIRHREFAMASGEMSKAEFVSFLNNSLRLLSDFSANNSVHFICMDWRHLSELLAAGQQNYDQLLNLCVWVKDAGGLGGLYRSQHELVLVFRKGKGPHRNNIKLGVFGRNRTNVWKYPGVQTLSKQGDEGNLLALHPTVKPIAMVADAILDCTARGEVVLDAFLGSGTTLMAAERVGRVCCGIEIDPRYVDVTIRRWQKQTGEAAIHACSKRRFDEIAAEREVRRG